MVNCTTVIRTAPAGKRLLIETLSRSEAAEKNDSAASPVRISALRAS